MTAFYDEEPDYPDREADYSAAEDARDEARVEARKESLWESAQQRTTDYLQPGELSRAASTAALRRHWIASLGDVGDPRAAAAQWLAYAREHRRGVEAAGVRECAVSTFHEAATMAARTFTTAYLDGNVQPVWAGAFSLLRDREVRVRATSTGRAA